MPEESARLRYLRDRQVLETVAAIRANCVPGETLLCHAGEYLHFGLRQFQVMLPEFDEVQLSPDPTMLTPAGKPLMAVRGGRLEFVRGLDAFGDRTNVLIVPPDLTVKIFGVTDAQPLTGAGGTAFVSREPIHK